MRVTFALGSAEIIPSSRNEIQAFVKALQSLSLIGKRFRVEGHTDGTGSPEANKRLSQARAEAVAAMLKAEGVSADRIEVKGYGSDNSLPGVPANDPENRRVELVPVDPPPARMSQLNEGDLGASGPFCDAGTGTVWLRYDSSSALNLRLRDGSGEVSHVLAPGSGVFSWKVQPRADGTGEVIVSDANGMRPPLKVFSMSSSVQNMAELMAQMKKLGCKVGEFGDVPTP
jgi:hypothetical protein